MRQNQEDPALLRSTGDTYYSITASSRQVSYAKPQSLLFLTPRPALSSHEHRTLVCLFLIWKPTLCYLTHQQTPLLLTKSTLSCWLYPTAQITRQFVSVPLMGFVGVLARLVLQHLDPQRDLQTYQNNLLHNKYSHVFVQVAYQLLIFQLLVDLKIKK